MCSPVDLVIGTIAKTDVCCVQAAVSDLSA